MTRFQGEKSKEKIRIIYPYSPLFSCVFILSAGGDAAADVPFAQIFVQHFAHRGILRRIQKFQPLGYVLVHGRFARIKMRRARAHRAARRQYVFRMRPHALVNVFPHLDAPSPFCFPAPRGGVSPAAVLRYDLIYVEVCTFMYCFSFLSPPLAAAFFCTQTPLAAAERKTSFRRLTNAAFFAIMQKECCGSREKPHGHGRKNKREIPCPRK